MLPPLDARFLMFRNRLEKVYRHRSKLARRQQISCYRLYDRDLPEFPLIIEVYGDAVYVAEYRSRHQLDDEAYEAWFNGSLGVIGEVLKLGQERLFCKLRERKDHRSSQYNKTGHQKNEFRVDEGGLGFIVNLGDYLDTGLFLDHRITRARVRDEASGKKVLNLFCYTGSFTVYAAAGGATHTTSIDLSNTYLDWAGRNLKLNQLDGPQHELVKGDVLRLLPELPNAYYDIIILDPPTFSNSKMMKDILDIQRDHVMLINTCLDKLKEGGHIYFSTNLRSFTINSQAIRASTVADITRTTTPFDFEGKMLRWAYLIS
jgi:23S rRNA (cytosine1962-C5)-methyltransferase